MGARFISHSSHLFSTLLRALRQRIAFGVEISDFIAPLRNLRQSEFDRLTVADNQNRHFIRRQILVRDTVDIRQSNGIDLRNIFVKVRIRQPVCDQRADLTGDLPVGFKSLRKTANLLDKY